MRGKDSRARLGAHRVIFAAVATAAKRTRRGSVRTRSRA